MGTIRRGQRHAIQSVVVRAGEGALGPSPWPEGDEVATAMLGLLGVELSRRACRGTVTVPGRVHVTGAYVGDWDLGELLRRLTALPKADWPEAVEAYTVARLECETTGPGACGWRTARPFLTSRLAALDGARLDSIVWRKVADGLIETLAMISGESQDGPGTPIGPQELRAWHVTAEEAFLHARANLREASSLTRTDVGCDEAPDVPVTYLCGDSGDTPGHVLWLGEHVDLTSAGALVVMPHAGLVAVHPIRSGRDAITAAGSLLRLAMRKYETMPSPLSDQLYWWWHGTLIRQPSRVVGEEIRLSPTADLAVLLRGSPRG